MTRLDSDQLGELLSAYVDRELDDAQMAQVERLLREDESARRRLAELRRMVNAVASLPRHPAPASIVADVQAALERSALLGDAPPARPHVHHARAPWTARLSMAAMLGIVFVGGWWFVRDRSPHAEKPVAETARDFQTPPNVGSERFAMVTAREMSIDEKLAGGASPATLQTHPFAAESVRMQVPVRDAAEQTELASRLTRRLADQRVVDLAKQTPSPSRNEAFFLRGSPGVNYAPAHQTQILVRATPQQIDEVLAEVGRAARSPASANLQFGPANVRSVEKSREFIQIIAQHTPVDTKDAATESAAPKAPPGDPSLAWLEDILEKIGVDPRSATPSAEVAAGPAARDDAMSRQERVDAGWSRELDSDRAEPTGAKARVPPLDEERRAKSEARDSGRVEQSSEPGLVDKRLDELNKAAGARTNQPPEQYITLVIELTPPPQPPEPSKGPGASKSNKRASETTGKR